MNKEQSARRPKKRNRCTRNISMVSCICFATGCVAQAAASPAQTSAGGPSASCPITNALTVEAYKTLTRMSYQSYQGGDNQAAADLADALWVVVGQSGHCLMRAGMSEEEVDKVGNLTHSFCRPLRWYKYHNIVVAKRDDVTHAYQELVQELAALK